MSTKLTELEIQEERLRLAMSEAYFAYQEYIRLADKHIRKLDKENQQLRAEAKG
jgi:hypothetical protein